MHGETGQSSSAFAPSWCFLSFLLCYGEVIGSRQSSFDVHGQSRKASNAMRSNSDA